MGRGALAVACQRLIITPAGRPVPEKKLSSRERADERGHPPGLTPALRPTGYPEPRHKSNGAEYILRNPN